MTPASFEFFAIEPLFDEDLKPDLADTQRADANAWHVPAYLFELQLHSGQYAGRIRHRVCWNDDIIKYLQNPAATKSVS